MLYIYVHNFYIILFKEIPIKEMLKKKNSNCRVSFLHFLTFRIIEGIKIHLFPSNYRRSGDQALNSIYRVFSSYPGSNYQVTIFIVKKLFYFYRLHDSNARKFYSEKYLINFHSNISFHISLKLTKIYCLRKLYLVTLRDEVNKHAVGI
jgi:hypothetical protein